MIEKEFNIPQSTEIQEMTENARWAMEEKVNKIISKKINTWLKKIEKAASNGLDKVEITTDPWWLIVFSSAKNQELYDLVYDRVYKMMLHRGFAMSHAGLRTMKISWYRSRLKGQG